MSNEHEYYFGLAMFEKTRQGETYYFTRNATGVRFVFEIRTHMKARWALKINEQQVSLGDIISAETLKHMLIGFGFLKENPLGFMYSVKGVYP